MMQRNEELTVNCASSTLSLQASFVVTASSQHMGAACLARSTPTATELRTASVRCVIIGPASAGKSLLQQKLLLDTPPTTSIPASQELYSDAEAGEDDSGKGFTAGSQHIRSGAIATGITAGPCVRFLEVFDVPAAELYRHLRYAEDETEAKGDDADDVARDGEVDIKSKALATPFTPHSPESSFRRTTSASERDDGSSSRSTSIRLALSARERAVADVSSRRVSVLARSVSAKSLRSVQPFMALLLSASYLLLVFDASDATGESLDEATSMYERVLPYLAALSAGKVTLVATKTDLVSGSAEMPTANTKTSTSSLQSTKAHAGDNAHGGAAFFLRQAADWAQERGCRMVEVSGLTGQGVRRLRAEMR